MQNHTILSFFTMKSRQNGLHTAKSCQKCGTERGAGDTVNHPHLIGVGMSREGYGQQVDKEA